jgi:hypothetical protein
VSDAQDPRLRPMTPESLAALSAQGRVAYERIRQMLTAYDVPAHALEVRMARVDAGLSWREIASACHQDWGGTWEPAGNQLVGMAICELAAFALGEDWRSPPWNEAGLVARALEQGVVTHDARITQSEIEEMKRTPAPPSPAPAEPSLPNDSCHAGDCHRAGHLLGHALTLVAHALPRGYGIAIVAFRDDDLAHLSAGFHTPTMTSAERAVEVFQAAAWHFASQDRDPAGLPQ